MTFFFRTRFIVIVVVFANFKLSSRTKRSCSKLDKLRATTNATMVFYRTCVFVVVVVIVVVVNVKPSSRTKKPQQQAQQALSPNESHVGFL